METSPDLTGNANRRSLDGNEPANCWSALQRHASQRTPQCARSKGRRWHEQSAVSVIAFHNQRQRDKAERRNQRKQEKAVAGSVDEMAELREQAAEQTTLFNVGADQAEDGGGVYCG
jgi:hypothetical protein